MNEIKKYIPLKGGLTCKKVNPAEPYGEAMSTAYQEFDRTNLTYDIATSTPMKEGEVFEGVQKYYEATHWNDIKEEFDYQEVSKEDYDLLHENYREIKVEPQTVQEDKPIEEYNITGPAGITITNKIDKPLPPTGNKEVELTDEQAVAFYMNYIEPNLKPSTKITVDEAAEIGARLHVSVMKVQNPEFEMRLYEAAFKAGAQWQQSISSTQDIDSIVGFVLEWVSKRATMIYHDGHNKRNNIIKHFTTGADNLQPNRKGILNMKSDIIKQLSNGK